MNWLLVVAIAGPILGAWVVSRAIVAIVDELRKNTD